MKAVEFESRLANRDLIQIPPDVAREIPQGSSVRVILLFDSGDDETWRKAAAERFAKAYAEEDAVYESLIDGPEPRRHRPA
jgi:hypothetical protein